MTHNIRPESYYDNYGDGVDSDNNMTDYSAYENDLHSKLRNQMLGYEKALSPTQTISLLTTVPQNITATNIAGRHAPTRNSLRHSRMIVMNRMTGKVPGKSKPPILRFHKLAKALVGLQAVLGMIICFIAFWVYLWTPSIRYRDNPFWSGIPLFVSGIIGLLLLCCFRKEYPGTSNGYCTYGFKVLSIFLSTVAGAACLIASGFALIHLINLSFMECSPSIELNETCVCNVINETAPLFFYKTYHYVDLHCNELNNFFVLLLIFSCGANFLGAIFALWYDYLHWTSRYLYTYSQVHTERLKPTIITNS